MFYKGAKQKLFESFFLCTEIIRFMHENYSRSTTEIVWFMLGKLNISLYVRILIEYLIEINIINAREYVISELKLP
jgi:hypothetical protein